MCTVVYVAWLGTTPMLGSQPEPCNSLSVLGEGCQKKGGTRSMGYLPEILNRGFFVEGLLPKRR